MRSQSSDAGLVDSGSDDWFATEEGERASGANGRAPDAAQQEPDPSWQPL